MKKVYLFVVMLLFASFTMAQTGITFFHGTWSETVAKAKAENKLIFIDFYTQWCGPCLNMAETVFILPTVGDYYNSTFVNAKIDAEHGEGVELAKKYGVRSYPTYAYVDPQTEELVHRSGSRQTAEQFVQTGKSATVPTLRSLYLESEYNKGNRDKQLLIDYINYENSIYKRNLVRTAFDELINGGAKLTETNVWDLYVNTISGADNPYLQQVSDNYDDFCKLFGKSVVDAKLAKETTYCDTEVLDKLCSFEGKEFNRQMILINKDLNAKRYDMVIKGIDAMIADSTVNQQELISRLRFIVRLGRSGSDIPDSWFYKCVEYLQYIAYNMSDRQDAYIHQEYAQALEEVLRRMPEKNIPTFITNKPLHGKKEYSMRPDVLKQKPMKKK